MATVGVECRWRGVAERVFVIAALLTRPHVGLRTLAFALTDRSYSLESACLAFGVEHGKQSVAQHGIVTKDYIDYNRRDVQATAELAIKLLADYAKHPIRLQPTKAFSPASIGKSCLHGMGISPILERQPDFPMEYLGLPDGVFWRENERPHGQALCISD